jgi:mono/diheme cytochrome c family protein
MRSSGVAIVLMLAAAPSAGAQEQETLVPDSVTPQRVIAGSELFNNGSCVVCHAPAGLGPTARAPDLADIEWLHGQGDFEGIRHTIIWGVPRDRMKAVTPRPFEMNPYGGMPLNNEQLEALTAYVWSLSRPETHDFVARQQRFLALARAGQTAQAVALFRESRVRYAGTLLLGENALNRFGYSLIDRPDVALEIFELNVELHPLAWNTHDSLGESLMLLGETQRAIRSYERSLELNPDNANAVEMLRRLRGGGG